jgi:hypothetical protein
MSSSLGTADLVAWALPWAPSSLNPALIEKLGLPANFNVRLQ